MVTIQKYVKAQSLEEAWKLNQGKRIGFLAVCCGCVLEMVL